MCTFAYNLNCRFHVLFKLFGPANFLIIRKANQNINSAYLGVTLTDGGTLGGFTPDCGSSTQGINVPTFIKWYLGR